MFIHEDGARSFFYASKAADKLAALPEEVKTLARDVVAVLESEARREETEKENRETCKRIAWDIEQLADGDAYKCPHCGAIVSKSDLEDTEEEDEDGGTLYTCPHCKEQLDAYDFEKFSIYDYFIDEALDVEYITDGNGEYKAVRICVATGGPHIEVDTDKQAVCLYWWGDKADYPLDRNAVNIVDDYASEMFDALR